MQRHLWIFGVLATCLSGCAPSYSPDTYASNAVQQANKVEMGVIIGVRKVGVSASGTVGTVTGGAAGGIAGSQVASGPISAFTALGGTLVGGLAGSAVEHASADTPAFEYIVRKPNAELLSVTQKDKVPLVLGQKVLVIAGTQARVVPDYTVPPDITAKADKSAEQAKAAEPPKQPETTPPVEPAKEATAPIDTPKPPEPSPPVEPVKTGDAAPAPPKDAAQP